MEPGQCKRHNSPTRNRNLTHPSDGFKRIHVTQSMLLYAYKSQFASVTGACPWCIYPDPPLEIYCGRGVIRFAALPQPNHLHQTQLNHYGLGNVNCVSFFHYPSLLSIRNFKSSFIRYAWLPESTENESIMRRIFCQNVSSSKLLNRFRLNSIQWGLHLKLFSEFNFRSYRRTAIICICCY